jgi:hypothetical protein
MGTLTIFWKGKDPTVLKGVSKGEGEKAGRNFVNGESIFVHYGHVSGVSSVYGTDRISEIDGLGYEESVA